MQTSTEAEEHLRIIRSLMEKATIYRAISAPVALVGGLCAVTLGALLHGKLAAGSDCARCFLTGWVSVLAVTMGANGVFIWRAARLRNEPFISAAMRKALWALFPPILCGAVFTALAMFAGHDTAWALPPMWMIFYGLGLLATAQFAPRSIPILGWVFLASGLASYLIAGGIGWGHLLGRPQIGQPVVANLLMTATFGLYHLLYAACTWPRRGGGSA